MIILKSFFLSNYVAITFTFCILSLSIGLWINGKNKFTNFLKLTFLLTV